MRLNKRGKSRIQEEIGQRPRGETSLGSICSSKHFLSTFLDIITSIPVCQIWPPGIFNPNTGDFYISTSFIIYISRYHVQIIKFSWNIRRSSNTNIPTWKQRAASFLYSDTSFSIRRDILKYVMITITSSWAPLVYISLYPLGSQCSDPLLTMCLTLCWCCIAAPEGMQNNRKWCRCEPQLKKKKERKWQWERKQKYMPPGHLSKIKIMEISERLFLGKGEVEFKVISGTVVQNIKERWLK